MATLEDEVRAMFDAGALLLVAPEQANVTRYRRHARTIAKMTGLPADRITATVGQFMAGHITTGDGNARVAALRATGRIAALRMQLDPCGGIKAAVNPTRQEPQP